jgi:hypothetical protein
MTTEQNCDILFILYADGTHHLQLVDSQDESSPEQPYSNEVIFNAYNKIHDHMIRKLAAAIIDNPDESKKLVDIFFKALPHEEKATDPKE